MRIIAGKFKGRILKFPKDKGVRPITDKAREAVFAILGDKTQNALVLDLYAGSGSLGIEALSRGAKFIDFVDINPKCSQVIRENLNSLSALKVARIFKMEVGDFLKIQNDYFYDLIFSSPPWRELDIKVIKKIVPNLAKNGIIIMEHSKRVILPQNLNDAELFKSRQYGDTKVSFYKRGFK